MGYKQDRTGQDEKKQTRRASAVGVVSQSATKGRCSRQGLRCINSGVNTLTVSAAQRACHWPAYELIRDALFLSEPRRGIRHATRTVQSLYKEIFIHVVSVPARCHSRARHKRRLRSQPRKQTCTSGPLPVLLLPPQHLCLRACAKPLFLLGLVHNVDDLINHRRIRELYPMSLA